MSESMADEDLPSNSLPRKGPGTETRRARSCRRNPQRRLSKLYRRSLAAVPSRDRRGAASRNAEEMEINAKLVKELRDRTGAGMMECKRALVEAKGDLAEAEIILRKHGIARPRRNPDGITQARASLATIFIPVPRSASSSR